MVLRTHELCYRVASRAASGKGAGTIVQGMSLAPSPWRRTTTEPTRCCLVMWFPQRLPALPSRRRVLAVAALVAHLFAATGTPVPSLRANSSDPSSAPYPCQNHPCGCVSAEQCWTGPCCCFTMREKVAWASEHGITPPAHALQLAEEEAVREARTGSDDGDCPKCRKKASPSHQSHSAGWVMGIFAQNCRGEGPAGLLKLEPSVPPAIPVAREATPAPAAFVELPLPLVTPTSHCPPTPPPRHC